MDDGLTEMYREQLEEDSRKIIRNSSIFEHHEAAIEEMRERYQYLLAAGRKEMTEEEQLMTQLIHDFDRMF